MMTIFILAPHGRQLFGCIIFDRLLTLHHIWKFGWRRERCNFHSFKLSIFQTEWSPRQQLASTSLHITSAGALLFLSFFHFIVFSRFFASALLDEWKGENVCEKPIQNYRFPIKSTEAEMDHQANCFLWLTPPPSASDLSYTWRLSLISHPYRIFGDGPLPILILFEPCVRKKKYKRISPRPVFRQWKETN